VPAGLPNQPQAGTTVDASAWPTGDLSQGETESTASGPKVYPYLLIGVDVVAVNQVWSTDITYLPVLKGHFYLVAIMDW